MPLHPQVKGVIERRQESAGESRPDATLAEKRAQFMNTWREAGPEVARVSNMQVPGPDGEVPIRVYWPSTEGDLPLLMAMHGGGFVFGGMEAYDSNARRLAIGAGCVVINVEYRLAPENKFPSAPEDCYSVLTWAADHAEELGIDPARIAVGGDSAGANLSTVMTLMARDRGGPMPVFQMLMCPALHPNWQPETHDPDETPPSRKDFWWEQYLRTESDASNPYAVPLVAEDLSGLPPALVITAEYDSLAAEGEAYAERLRQAGVEVTLKRFEGMWHIFHMYPESIDGGRAAFELQTAALRAAFSS